MTSKNPITYVSLQMMPDSLGMWVHRGDKARTYHCYTHSKKYNPTKRHQRMTKIANRTLQQTRNKIDGIASQQRRS